MPLKRTIAIIFLARRQPVQCRARQQAAACRVQAYLRLKNTAAAQELTREGRYTALLVSMEVGAAFNDDIGKAELAMLGAWRSNARAWLLHRASRGRWD
jgi:hypothetical protein